MKKSFKKATQCYFEKFRLSEQQFKQIDKLQSDIWHKGHKISPGLKWYQNRQIAFSLAGAAVVILIVGLQWADLSGGEERAKKQPEVAYNRPPIESGLTIREQIDKQLNQQQVRLAEPGNKSSLSRNVSYRSPANRVATYNPINSLRRQIASEIAYNYNKNLTMEIRTTNLKKVDEFYNKLDFSPVIPEVLRGREWQLLGGRYCSIQQRLAAQMKLFNSGNQKIYALYQYQLAEDSILRHFTEPWQIEKDNLTITLWVEEGLLHAVASD